MNMKKMIALLLALLMVFSMVACGAKEEAPVAKEEAPAASEEKTEEKTEPETPADKPAKADRLPKDVRKSLILILISVSMWFMGYNAVTTSFSKYAQDYLQIKGGGFASMMMIATVAAVISYIPAGNLASKIGRKKTILIGVVLLGGSFATAFAFKEFHWLMLVLFVITGMGWAAINVNSYPMVVEMSKGSNIGKYTGYYYTFSMAAQILTPILSGFFLEKIGYWVLFPYSVVFVAIAFCTMLFVKHGDNRPNMPKDKLEMLDVGD